MSDALFKLRQVTRNLHYEWMPGFHDTISRIDPEVCDKFQGNIHLALWGNFDPCIDFQYKVQALAQKDLLARIDALYQAQKTYLESSPSFSWPQEKVAYFSMEYGFESLLIYSGGLGILSGDHLRGASDLGLPLVAAGLFYQQGYFQQRIDIEGHMKARYPKIYPHRMSIQNSLPLEEMVDPKTNQPVILKVTISQREVACKVWRAHIGKVRLYLLDTDVKENNVRDRYITQRLYASKKHREQERERRLEQEIILGVGGFKAIHLFEGMPNAIHLNEGHVAFAVFEMLREKKISGSRNVHDVLGEIGKLIGFTTHTPVPEGNERFDAKLFRDKLLPYLLTFLTPQEAEELIGFGINPQGAFDMTQFSLRVAHRYRNGVSQLHGEVCRQMWSYLWGASSEHSANVPIKAITNAVHVPFWQKNELRELLEKSGGFKELDHIPSNEIWKMHQFFKQQLTGYIKKRLFTQIIREGEEQHVYDFQLECLEEDNFIIGFARRFAQYKRVTLVLDDEDLLFQSLEHYYRQYKKPVIFLFAGKPHPDNYPGRNRIHQIYTASRRLEKVCKERDFKAAIIFIEGYDISLAKNLEAGCDVWLNNPIRPLEASGTSGMKAAINGVLNVSIDDGWVPEGIISGKNGWIFGKGDEGSKDEDRLAFFHLLESEILPCYFGRNKPNDAFSENWVKMMKRSISSIMSYFNTQRMLQEYSERMYFQSSK